MKQERLATHFWLPGIRSVVRRTADRTIVDVTVHTSNASHCCVNVHWQRCNDRGLAAVPPLKLSSGQLPLHTIPSEGISEGRLILPTISDDIWPQCYLSLCRDCRACQTAV